MDNLFPAKRDTHMGVIAVGRWAGFVSVAKHATRPAVV
jgi:hypothetical protein